MRKLALSDEQLLRVEKPVRYIGGEINTTVKNLDKIDIRFCMAFPDVYEIGMSHLGIQVLYHMFNQRRDTYCERVFSPWFDLDGLMRKESIPLFALESQDPIKDFDFLGITLQYEMSYTNILQILELSQIPIYSKDRSDQDPLVIGGGPCSYNPEPIADFFDLFYIGEGEVAYNEMLDLYKKYKTEKKTKREFLQEVAKIEGIYVPCLYDIIYNEDMTISKMVKNHESAKEKILKQVAMDLDEIEYLKNPIIPFVQVVQDRVVLEIQRGCMRGCRFCQAGMIYRPLRERSLDCLKELARDMLHSTGHNVISMTSLSTSDYSRLDELIDHFMDEFMPNNVKVSLPSLRIGDKSLEIMSGVENIKKSSLTFAPEAGSQRLRDVINKGITEEEIYDWAYKAFRLGWDQMKLYFMLGLPTETIGDVEAIAILGDQLARIYYEMPKEKRQKRVSINLSTSFFIPKAFTPFQWVAMDRLESFLEKQKILNSKINDQLNRRSINYQWHQMELSQLEGAISRGDRRISKVIYDAYKKGCLYDSWTEHLKHDKWLEAFDDNGIDIDFYNHRTRDFDEVLPWDFIDIGVSKDFLYNEFKKALKEETTPNCREECSACGAEQFAGGICFEERTK